MDDVARPEFRKQPGNKRRVRYGAFDERSPLFPWATSRDGRGEIIQHQNVIASLQIALGQV